MDLIKHFWYPIHIERQKEKLTSLKTIRTTLVSAIFSYSVTKITVLQFQNDPCLRYIDYEITLHLQMEHDLTMTTHIIPYYDLKNIVIVKKKRTVVPAL